MQSITSRTIPVFCAALSALLSSPLVYGQVLFSDTFDRPDSTNVSASSAGMSGSLVPLTYFQTSGADISSQRLRAGGGSTATVVPLHNFTDPAIVAAGGFKVSFDITPPDTNDIFGSADWGALGIGYSQSDATTGGLTIIGNKAFGFLVRGAGGPLDTGVLSLSGNGNNGLGQFVYNQAPVPDQTFHVELQVTRNPGQTLFVAGQTATALITITGDLNATPGIDLYTKSQSFPWIGSNNYLMLEGSDPVDLTTFDNFEVSVVPEPTALSLIVAGAMAFNLRRARARGDDPATM